MGSRESEVPDAGEPANGESQDFLRSPVARCIAAKQRGQRFFQTEIEVGTLFGGSGAGLRVPAERPDVLGQIEQEGWRLEQAGYVYLDTSPVGAGRWFSSDSEARGAIIGVYLFRNVDSGR